MVSAGGRTDNITPSGVREDVAMTVDNWKRTMYVSERRSEKKGIDVQVLMNERRVEEAAVVPVGWLFEQLVKCLNNGQETIRIAAGANGAIYIETFMDAEDIDGYTGTQGIDPPGWNDDWPRINLP